MNYPSGSPVDHTQTPIPAPNRDRASRTDRVAMGVARASGAVLAVTTLLAGEAVAVGLVHRAELAGAWELRVAVLRLVPIGLLVAVPLGLVGHGLLLLLDSSERIPCRGSFSLATALGAGAVAYGVSFGRHFHQPLLRTAFVIAVALVSGVLAWFVARPLARFKQRTLAGFLMLALLAVVCVQTVNANVLPRLYPAFHGGLCVLALFVGSWLGEIFVGLSWHRGILAIAGALVLLSGTVSARAARDLENWDNVRVVFASHAPWLSQAVRIASHLVGREEAQSDQSTTSRSASSTQRYVDWTGHDILLVSIDALRADHLGILGYARNVTPEIDALGGAGVVFAAAYCATPHTSYSVTSLMTGKYMRPLLLQQMGEDSETFAGLMRVYGYRTAAFYPPAVFAIDPERFSWVEKRDLDFEYRKVEYAIAEKRLDQIRGYLDKTRPEQHLFLWVHLFEPHEPYEAHPAHDFGDRDIDRYDAEIAVADEAVGKIVRAVREKRPRTVVIVTSDHGEEFGEHGGYYHGTTVYEEQVRVPLIVSAEGLAPRTVSVPVQLIDILPTVLRALDIPRSPRIRGNDLGPWLVGRGQGEGMAFSETEEQTMLAQDRWRLVCQRKIDACALYDVDGDSREQHNVSAPHVETFGAMRNHLRALAATHGRYELSGAREEGRELPAALRRGLLGDADATRDVAALLDDADVAIRRKAAEALFLLKNAGAATSLRLALSRDEDDMVKRWCALALTRLGQGAPRTAELLHESDLTWSRLAALALAESGDARGDPVLVSWWTAGVSPFERAKEVAAALGHIRSTLAIVPLAKSLGDARLRPHVAAALAQIGDPYGRIALMTHFPGERYETSRKAIGEALVSLGASRELAPALARFLGVPDPLPQGVALAARAKTIDLLGGPAVKDCAALERATTDGAAVRILVPKGGNGKGVRVIARARARGEASGEILIGRPREPSPRAAATREPPSARLEPKCAVRLQVSGRDWQEVHARFPDCARMEPGKFAELILVPGREVEIETFVVVPLADEIPPPAPEPWEPPEHQETWQDGSP